MLSVGAIRCKDSIDWKLQGCSHTTQLKLPNIFLQLDNCYWCIMALHAECEALTMEVTVISDKVCNATTDGVHFT